MGLGGLKGGWVVAPKQDNDAFSGPYSICNWRTMSNLVLIQWHWRTRWCLWSLFNMQLKDNELQLVLIQLLTLISGLTNIWKKVIFTWFILYFTSGEFTFFSSWMFYWLFLDRWHHHWHLSPDFIYKVKLDRSGFNVTIIVLPKDPSEPFLGCLSVGPK